jgi:hypothetical protein
MIGYKDKSIKIYCKLDNGEVNQYPYAIIKDSDNVTVSSMALNHKFSGNYTSSWVPSKTGYFNVNYSIYSDSNHMTLNTNYNQGAEEIWVIEELPTSSQATESTYGGGGSKSYFIPGGKKSPWTHEQRDKVIKATQDTKEIVKKLEKDMEKYHEKEIKLIDKIIDLLRTLQGRLEKAKTDEEYENIQEDILTLTKMLNEIMPEEAKDRVRKKL